jgi:hypothetical protein
MEVVIIKAVLIINLIGILYHLLIHLLIIFYPKAKDMAIKAIIENTYKYVINEQMCYVIRNMVYLFICVVFLVAACNGNVTVIKKKDSTGININK